SPLSASDTALTAAVSRSVGVSSAGAGLWAGFSLVTLLLLTGSPRISNAWGGARFASARRCDPDNRQNSSEFPYPRLYADSHKTYYGISMGAGLMKTRKCCEREHPTAILWTDGNILKFD